MGQDCILQADFQSAFRVLAATEWTDLKSAAGHNLERLQRRIIEWVKLLIYRQRFALRLGQRAMRSA